MDPRRAAPIVQLNPADMLPFFDKLHKLAFRPDDETSTNEAFLASVVSHQHPDHDTTAWPPETTP